MADLINIPKQTFFKTTLASPVAATQTDDIVLSAVPGYTPTGETVYLSFLDPDNPEVISATGWNSSTKILTGVVRGVSLVEGVSASGLAHGAGITVVMSDPFNVYKDIQTAIATKADGTPVLDGSRSVYADDTARDAAVPIPEEGYEVVTNGVKQVFIGGAWQDLDIGTPTPNFSTTVAGKGQGATQTAANNGTLIGSTGANNIMTPDVTAVVNQDDKHNYAGSTGGSSTAYTATLTPAPTAYAAGQEFTVLMNATNGANPTINFNSLGAKSIVDSDGNVIPTGLLVADALVTLRYNGTEFQVMNAMNPIAPVVTYYKSYDLGDSTTRFDITNPSGTTFRYTYDGTGTDPGINAANIPVGSVITPFGTNFNAGNQNKHLTVTAVDTNYFEATNASGVAETNKTIGTGFMAFSPVQTWTKGAGLKKVVIEQVGGGGGAVGSNTSERAGAGGAGYSKKTIPVASLGATETVTVGYGGLGGDGGVSPSWSPTAGGTSSFGAHCSATGGAVSSGETGGVGGIGVNGDLNVAGSDGGSFDASVTSVDTGSYGGGSFFGGSAKGTGSGGDGARGKQYGGGGGGPSDSTNTGGCGYGGVISVTEFY